MTRLRLKKNLKKLECPDRMKPKATNFRFRDSEHYDLLERACAKSGLSLNAWLVGASEKQAQLELTEI